MERRDFLKISAITGATAALDSCGKPERQLIRFVPEEDLTPGVATWKPGICTVCPAGCGLMVRVMEGEAEVIRNGQLGIIKMGLAKKIEGNPQHPISQGKLCPRGQAGLQITYHPDRVRNPLKRSGPRGSGQYQEISWDEATKGLVAQLAALQSGKQESSLGFITKPLRGQRGELIMRFLQAFGASAPVIFEFFDAAVLRRANALSFGRPQLPTFDLAHSNYVISFGADFLGTWNSPVAQNIGYGQMRQGRPGMRAKLVQVELRMSQTGANADEWIPARPGGEGILALGLAHVMMREKLRPAAAAGRAGALIAGWSEGLPNYTPEEVEKRTGVAAAKITRLAREIAAHGPAMALIGGVPLAQTNGLFNALAVNALNALIGSVGKPGGLLFTPQPSVAARTKPAGGKEPVSSSVRTLAQQVLSGQPRSVKALLLYEANPVFTTPPGWHVREALEKVPFIASFGSFIDETSSMADVILPDHSPLESWLDDVPESGALQAVASLAAPAMRPLHNTRAMPDVLLEVAHQLGGSMSAAFPAKDSSEMLKSSFEALRRQKGSIAAGDADSFWSKVQEDGGWWSAQPTGPPLSPSPVAQHGLARLEEPEFDGTDKDFPFYFQPFASQMFYDGSLAHLPWMQEAPDPLATAMWGTWVEINPQTAERLNVRQGDLVEVASRHGKVRAPALISPGIAPDVIAMPVGQGHENYTRYASVRGANPVSILAPTVEPETQSLAWAATRVRISRVGKGKPILFAGGMREKPVEHER